MCDAVRRTIVEAIRDRGSISFAEYMELALYGPDGYYDDPPVGAGGDFVTSPHVHPVFAEMLARGIRELWENLGRPEPLRLAEVGAGDGTLASQLLEAPDLPPTDYTAVERSAGAARALADLAGVGVRDHMPSDPHVVLAHELLDNLPFRRIRMTTHGPVEVRVGLDDPLEGTAASDGGRLVETLEATGADLAPYADGLEPGEETVVPEGAFAFVDRLATALVGGYALVIDYGAIGSPGGRTHGYRGHRVVEDPLDRPGTADITAGVNFGLIARRATERGLVAFETTTQRRALSALGFEGWIRSEVERQRRLLDEGQGMPAVRAWGGRSRATLLADPGALGRSRWLLLARPGVPAPSWLERALTEPGPRDLTRGRAAT